MLQKVTLCYTVDQQTTTQYYYDTFICVTGPNTFQSGSIYFRGFRFVSLTTEAVHWNYAGFFN